MSHAVYQRADVDGVSVFYREAGPPDYPGFGHSDAPTRPASPAPSITWPRSSGASRINWAWAATPCSCRTTAVLVGHPLTAEAEAYRRDVPGAEVHLLDAGHFALDEQPDRVAALTRGFLGASAPSALPV